MDHQPNSSQASSSAVAGNNRVGLTITRIEDILETVVDSLKDNRPLKISLRSRRTGKQVPVTFPSTTSVGGKKFTALLQVLYFIHEALVSGTVISKRNIYYQNPGLFGNQRYVDDLVDDISFTLGVSRDSLSVVAASKGLIAGGSFDPGEENTGVPVPQLKIPNVHDFRSTRWVLVIEKEATFRSLVASRYFETSDAGPGILITAKGYPDLATRQFLHLVQRNHPRIPIHALVDFDPDGLAIMRTYKHGSQALNHEENVTIPGLYWLGIKSSDVLPSRLGSSSFTPSSSQASQQSNGSLFSSQNSSVHGNKMAKARMGRVAERCLCPLTVNDRKKGISILRALDSQHEQDSEQMTLTRELQLMLMLNLKAEIQAVDDAGDITKWLDNQLCADLDFEVA